MNRQRVMFWGGILSGSVLLYCVSFGPFVYVITFAERHQFFPEWLGKPVIIAYYPHLWACYHSEPYFNYIGWFADKNSSGSFTWKDFRKIHADKFRLCGVSWSP